MVSYSMLHSNHSMTMNACHPGTGPVLALATTMLLFANKPNVHEQMIGSASGFKRLLHHDFLKSRNWVRGYSAVRAPHPPTWPSRQGRLRLHHLLVTERHRGYAHTHTLTGWPVSRADERKQSGPSPENESRPSQKTGQHESKKNKDTMGQKNKRGNRNRVSI